MSEDIKSIRRENNIVTVKRAQRVLLRRAWQASKGNQRLTARLLGVHLRTVQRWIVEDAR